MKKVCIIGGGHNGLVCACYLAHAGFDVTILEQKSIVGGAAITEEFYPGFKNSSASYTVGLLSPTIIQDLNLEQHGLKIVPRPLNNFMPLDSDYYLKFGSPDGISTDMYEMSKFSREDAANYPAFLDMLERVAKVFRQFASDTPPTTKGLRNIFSALKAAGRLNNLSPVEQKEVIDLFTMSAYDVVSQYFKHPYIQALFCWDSIVGTYTTPLAQGTAYVLLHHVWGGSAHGWGHAIGGMGSITQAMEREAIQLGVQIKRGKKVNWVTTLNDKIHVSCENVGRPGVYDIVVSNVHPHILFTKLLNKGDSELTNLIKSYKSGSATFRMNFALDRLPTFLCHPTPGDHLGSGILIMPTIKYMEKAYFDAREFGWSQKPVIELLIPSYIDDTLAPPGKHVMSAFCQHFDPDLEWNVNQKNKAIAAIENTIEDHAPGFKSSILGKMALSPRDLEEQFGLVKGDIFHGALSLNQLYSCRPVLGYGNYRTDIPGLYMCGSGTHPGGGVTGIPGRNAAREIIKDN